MGDNRRYYGGEGVLQIGNKFYRANVDELPDLPEDVKDRLKAKGNYVKHSEPEPVKVKKPVKAESTEIEKPVKKAKKVKK